MYTLSDFAGFWATICQTYRPGEIELASVLFTTIFGFFIPAIFYLLIDMFFPDFSRRHKIQSSERQPTSREIRNAIFLTTWNHIWPTLLLALGLWWTDFMHTAYTIDPALPSLKTIATDFVFALFAREISFYYVHRLLHHPRIYKYIHKKHHTYTTPVSFSAEYAHPVEQILANILPVSLPLALKRAHMLSAVIFGMFELWEAAADHSGYDFWKLPPAKLHDLHHEKFNVNYGTIGLMDWIHGTNVVGWDRKKKKTTVPSVQDVNGQKVGSLDEPSLRHRDGIVWGLRES